MTKIEKRVQEVTRYRTLEEYLANYGGCTLRDLAHTLKVSPSGLAKAIERMYRKKETKQ